MQDAKAKEIMIDLVSQVLQVDLVELKYDSVEEFNSISEYNFYIIKLIAYDKYKNKNEIFFKVIKKGKIKESLFCIYALAYEKYFENLRSKEHLKKPKRIAILEKKENVKHYNKVIVNLYEDIFKKEKLKTNIEINFIEISKIIKQSKYKNINLKGWDNFIKTNYENILLIGINRGIDL